MGGSILRQGPEGLDFNRGAQRIHILDSSGFAHFIELGGRHASLAKVAVANHVDLAGPIANDRVVLGSSDFFDFYDPHIDRSSSCVLVALGPQPHTSLALQSDKRLNRRRLDAHFSDLARHF